MVFRREEEKRGGLPGPVPVGAEVDDGDGSPSQFNIFCTWPGCRPIKTTSSKIRYPFHIEVERARALPHRRRITSISFVAERAVRCFVFICDCHSTRLA